MIFRSSEMTSHDCFEMGRQSYVNRDYYHTMLWMNEAMRRLNNDTSQTMSTSRADILEYLAFSVFKQGMVNVLTRNFDSLTFNFSENATASLPFPGFPFNLCCISGTKWSFLADSETSSCPGQQ